MEEGRAASIRSEDFEIEDPLEDDHLMNTDDALNDQKGIWSRITEWQYRDQADTEANTGAKRIPWYARYFVRNLEEIERRGVPLYELDHEGNLRHVDRDEYISETRWFNQMTGDWLNTSKYYDSLRLTRGMKKLAVLLLTIVILSFLWMKVLTSTNNDNPDLNRHHQFTEFDPFITYSNGTHEFNPLNIVISLSGFYPGLISDERTPFISALFKREHNEILKQNITTSPYMRPQFPLQSIPNMWTMVTGLYPSMHKMIANSFWDSKNEVEYRPGIIDPRVWVNNSEPIWETVQRAYNHDDNMNFKVYANMWPGSDVNYTSLNYIKLERQPYYMDVFDAQETMETKKSKIFNYIDTEDITERPQMILSVVNDLDTFGHLHGYPIDRDSPHKVEFLDKLKSVDQFINDTFAGLHERNMSAFTNILLVSNHGMADINFDNNVTIWEDLIHNEREYLRENDVISHMYMEGASLGIYVREAAHINPVYKIIKKHIDLERYNVFLAGNFPKEWNYDSINKDLGRGPTTNADTGTADTGTAQLKGRLPTIWIVPKIGNSIMLKEKYDIIAKKAKKEKKKYHGDTGPYVIGSHTFSEVDDARLQALFIATGPYFKDQEIGPINNLDIYNLLCDINGVSIRDRNPNNGTTSIYS